MVDTDTAVLSEVTRMKNAGESNTFLSYTCMKRELYKLLLHCSNMDEEIARIKSVFEPEFESEELDEMYRIDQGLLHDHSSKILADIVEALIGAVFMDTKSIEDTYKFWTWLFPDATLQKYADNPERSPKEEWQKIKVSKAYMQPLISEMKVEQGDDHLYQFTFKGHVLLEEQYDHETKAKAEKFYESVGTFFKEQFSIFEKQIKNPKNHTAENFEMMLI